MVNFKKLTLVGFLVICQRNTSHYKQKLFAAKTFKEQNEKKS